MAQFTKKAITEGFWELLNEKSFDKIAVVDIAERCGINRNTFYYYYPDVYALVDEILQDETKKMLDRKHGCDTWQEVVLQVTAFARANRTAVYHLYNSINLSRLQQYLYDVAYLSMDSFIHKEVEGQEVREEDVRAIVIFCSSALLGLVTRWLQDGMKSDAEAYITSLGRLLEGNVRQLLLHAGQTP